MEVLAAALVGLGLGAAVLAVWPPPRSSARAVSSALTLHDGTSRTLH